ncbi:ANTAR domain-containing protein [Solicola sp. PLA-1-18]|uniref:ANTAR domain-containing protein n=1 Tax=Solicola sp. PLA-1-18 TaxID=3380532 RepID=UPI003B7B23A7
METVHLFSGYVLDRSQVRACCSCGFTTGPAPAQRTARRELLRDHHLTRPVCETCGRGDPGSLPVGLPTFLVVRVDDATDRPRVVCAPGGGGCDDGPAGSDDPAPGAAPDGTAAVGDVDGLDEPDGAATIARAEGVLMAFHAVDPVQAGERLAARARRADISLLEAAHRVLVAVAGDGSDSAGTAPRAGVTATRRR